MKNAARITLDAENAPPLALTNDIYPSRKFQVPIQPRARVETGQ
jgi:hypothetical protein